MSEPLGPTQYTEINAVLHDFASQLCAILGDNFRGMYLSGSLALVDFDLQASDIDFIVLTGVTPSADIVDGLRDMHDRFDAGNSPWAGKIEAVYITPEALHLHPLSPESYP
jgi:hypothetical protein